MVGVILAAGDGERLKNSCKDNVCKPLLKIKDKKLIEFALDNLVALQIDAAYIVVGKEGDLIKRTLGEKYKNVELYYIYQLEQKGLLNAFIQAVDIIGCDETVLLQLADEIFVGLRTEEIRNIIENPKHQFYCGVTFEGNPEEIKKNYSVETAADMSIIACTEKPNSVTNNIKGTGLCIFNKAALKALYKGNESKRDLCDYINFLVAEGYGGLSLQVAKKEFNINTFADLKEAQRFFETDLSVMFL